MLALPSLSRKYGIPLMFIMPLLIVIFLGVGIAFNDKMSQYIAGILWFFLLIDSLFISLNGHFFVKGFNVEVNKFTKQGFPIKSLEGYLALKNRIQSIGRSTLFIALIVLISFISYLLIIIIPLTFDTLFNNHFLNTIFTDKNAYDSFRSNITGIFTILLGLTALSLILIAIGIVLLLNLPEKPALVPGALMKYYYPPHAPSQLDVLLADAVYPFLDPITRTRWDIWTQYIQNNLNPKYQENELELRKRLGTAREHILILAYISQTMPEIYTNEVLKNQFRKILKDEEALNGFYDGKTSGITWKIIITLIKSVQKNAPEIFRVVDRLFIELDQNLASFKENSLYINTSTASRVIGNTKPFRVAVFLLNRDMTKWAKDRRPVTITTINKDLIYPDSYTINLHRASGTEIKADKLPYSSDTGDDIVSILSRILRNGNTVWLQFARPEFGRHQFDIRVIEHEEGTIYGRSIIINQLRDFGYYLTTYGGQIFALAGAAIPIVGGLALTVFHNI